MQKLLDHSTRLKLLQLTIVLIPFSYQPRIYLDSIQGLAMEVSFVQIAGALFVLFSLPSVFKNIKKLISSWPIKLLAGFTLFNWLSIFWSADIVRNVVLSTYWTFLFFVVVCIASLFIDKKPKQKDITNPLMAGTIIGLAFGTWQYLGVMIGLDSSVTLIRHAYNAELFGFARIQTFALEPQFYASTLIAPLLYLSWRILFKKYNYYHLLILGWTFGVFLLTVSRGAVAGFVVAIIVMLAIFAWSKKIHNKLLKFSRFMLALTISFMVVIGLIFVSGEMQGEKHTGLRSVETFIDHMSHNVIDINLRGGEGGEEVDGLVEDSTTGRFFMVENALEIFVSSQSRTLFGVGAGSFGPVYQMSYKNVDRINHVVNNQYVEILAELGIVGLALFLSFAVSLAKDIYQKTRQYKWLLLTILIAYLVQYMFFSLQTNVLQIWLFVGVAIGVILVSSEVKNGHSRKQAN